MDSAARSILSVNDRTKQDHSRAAPARDSLDMVMRYHQETKHHFSRFARSLGYLDWANQPDPFRRYEGSPVFALPLLKPADAPASPLYEDLYRPGAIASVSLTVRSLSRLFEYSLAISAWKQAGEVRWALRSNPSSGNLHPTEAYLLIDDIDGLSPSPGLYHYAAKEHALELRAQWSTERFMRLLQGFPPKAFLVGFASIIWRETWKYGERAFRYCQHDVGHAIGSVRIAAQTLGWRMLLLDGLADDTLAALLGVDRAEDFEGAEREHPDCIAVIWPSDQASGAVTGSTSGVPLFLAADALCDVTGHIWHGRANRLSRDEPVQWEILDQAVVASWKSSTEQKVVQLNHERRYADPSDHPKCLYVGQPSAGQVIRQRRSAVAFDGTTSISAGSFFTMLTRVMPGAERDPPSRAMPWDVLPWEPAVHLALFVHRVDGLVPGLYLLARDPAKLDLLRGATHPQFDWSSVAGCPDSLPLFLLQEGDERALAAELSCRQDIAGDSAFSLGMIAEFESSLRQHGPWFYRRLFWETGLIGQVLYLEAEAAGVRATGIGCFFDDPVHQIMGFNDAGFQSLYHFTTGAPVEDPRLTTLPPYALDH
jgi:SagB-type dehydrogenase family enzyme